MENNLNEWYKPVLSKYHIKPEYIESNGQVKKIFTKNGTFALKRLTNKQPGQFFNIIEHLYHNGYTKIAPIIKTVDKQPFIFHQNQLYYLTPWFQSNILAERTNHQNQMLKELARLHHVTAKKVPIKKEVVAKIYEDVKGEWERKIHFLENYIDLCEKKWYMSPFELQYCTTFHEILKATDFARNRLDDWYEIAKEKKDARMVVNHGKVSEQHFVYDQNEHGLFISFEKAKHALPIYDLIGYFHHVLRTYPITSDECKECFNYYQSLFPFYEEEKSLFLSYFVFPDQAYRVVKKYAENEGKMELKFVSYFQEVNWQQKNIEYVVMRILEEAEIDVKEEEGADTHGTL